MPFNILVTGGAGFIGSRTASALLAEDHHVVILDDLNDYYDPSLKLGNLDLIGTYGPVVFKKGGILDKKLLMGIMDEHDIEIVYHFAAQPGVAVSLSDPLKTCRINIGGTLSVL